MEQSIKPSVKIPKTMSYEKQKRLGEILKFTILGLILAVYMMPLYITIVYAFKTKEAIMLTGIAPPLQPTLENFKNVFANTPFFNSLKNSTIVTLCAVAVLITCSSMCAYVITRNARKKFYNVLYFVFLQGILLPFQVIMMPLYKSLFKIGINDTLPGLILCLIGFSLSYDTFVYAGFIKGVPVDVEESALIDGAGQFRTFWQIVFPLLKPITSTLLVLNVLSTWNEFMIPLVVIQSTQFRTLPLLSYFFFGQYVVELGMAFACFLLTMTPVLVLYFFMQQYIIKGITAGAVKG